MGPVIPNNDALIQDGIDRVETLSETVVKFRDSISIKNWGGQPNKDVNEQLIRGLGSRAGISTFLLNATTQTADRILTATRVFADADSTPQQKASSALKCMSALALVFSVTGPIGVAVSTAFAAVLGIITFILDATAGHRDKEMSELVTVLRGLNAELAAHEVETAHSMLKTQYAVVRSFADNSKTWNEILPSAQIMDGITQFKLAMTGQWLHNPQNQMLEKWEEVFNGYAEAVVLNISLQLLMLQKLSNEESRKASLAALGIYGNKVVTEFEELMEAVNDCGDLWHVDLGSCRCCQVTNPGRPARAYDGWHGVDFGLAASIAVSPRTDRIWVDHVDGPAMTSGARLATGEDGKMYVFEDPKFPHGVIDICLVPWAGTDMDLLVVTATGKDSSGPGYLLTNAWHEKHSRWFTKEELERTPPVSGFTSDFFKPRFLTADSKPEDVAMARTCHAFPTIRFLGEPASTGYEDCVYVVTRGAKTGDSRPHQLKCTKLKFLTSSPPNATMVDRALPPALASVTDQRFRITTTKENLYVYTSRAIWRADHASVLSAAGGVWRHVNLPEDGTDWKSMAPEWENGSRWWSNGVNDLHGWSDDDLVGVLSNGALWSGHFDVSARTKWRNFDLLLSPGLQDKNQLPQGGRELIVIAEVGTQLHFRVFDAERKIIVDTNESQLTDHSAEIAAIRGILGHNWPVGSSSIKPLLITAVTEFLGARWHWKRINGGVGRTIIKRKHSSWDYCKTLHQTGLNLAAGNNAALPAA